MNKLLILLLSKDQMVQYVPLKHMFEVKSC
jgi:hypothetical protein